MTTPIQIYKETIARVERAKGINTATAKIVAEIFSTPKEISLEELSTRTGYSLATVSNTIKFLEPIGVILRLKQPGSKRIYVRADRDFLSVLVKNMNRTHDIALRPLKQTLPELIKEQRQLIRQAKDEKTRQQLKAEQTIMQEHLQQVQLAEELIDHVIEQCNKRRKET